MIVFIALADIGDILVTFEQQVYVVSENDANVEVCAVPSATPAPGQTVSALFSTVDSSALGK